MNDCDSLLAGFPIVATIPVLWGDEDAFGHVNNVMYLRWCETARMDYLVKVGLLPHLPPRGVAPILAGIKCDYRLALNYPDTVDVGARITRIGNSSMRMEHRVVSRMLGMVAAEVDSTLVLLDYASNRPVTVPPEVRKTIGELEGRPIEDR
jgi:acyl-CoA thioester hydrolase